MLILTQRSAQDSIEVEVVKVEKTRPLSRNLTGLVVDKYKHRPEMYVK